jgi:hypothetical protein
MIRTRAIVALCFFVPAAAIAQANPTTDIVRQIALVNDKMMVTAAEAMPAEKYTFKPSSPQMSFGEAVIHTEDTNRFECAAISQLPAPAEAKLSPADNKSTLVAALKASFEFCNTALTKVHDVDLRQTVPYYGGKPASKAAVLIDLAADWGDHYAILAMYLRLNGIVPPSAR